MCACVRVCVCECVRVCDCFKSRQNEKEISVSSKQRFEEVSQQVALEKERRKNPIIQKKQVPVFKGKRTVEKERRVKNSRADFPF